MKKYEYYYTTKPNNCAKYVLVSMLAIFIVSVSSFVLMELHNFYTDESSIVKILKNSLKSSETKAKNFDILTSRYDTNEDLQNSERQARAVVNKENSSTISTEKTNFYYEEQKPVVVYSKTDADTPLRYEQLNEAPPKQDSDDDEDPYTKALTDDDYDYFGQPESPPPYYRQPQDQTTQQQQQFAPYYRSQPPPNNYYRSQPSYSQYFDDSKEDLPASEQNPEETRASQYRDFNYNYYRQEPYATTPPSVRGLNIAGNRIRPLDKGQQQPQQNRKPYPAYMDDYDYMPSHSQAPQPYPFAHYRNAPSQQQQQQPQQMPQYRTPSSSSPIQAEEKDIQTRPQMDMLTIIKSLKSMWDIYQSFSSSWNTIAERRNREEQLAKQKYEQLQQIRINSKKPPAKFNAKRNQTNNTKNPKKQITTTTTTTVATLADNFSEEEILAKVKKQPPAKVEPRKATKGDKSKTKNVEGLRDKRQAAMEEPKAATDVSEGRYIKGDPLKGYYDFVITEGSYKFWAAFQVGTALLIIYSTFAAIYYSKVNPLVSDYDYTDYLGGARSLSGGDLDFVDDDDDGNKQLQKAQPKSWLEWLPRTGHSLSFILDAIDKLPTDHEVKSVEGITSNSNENYNSIENKNTDYENSKEMEEVKQSNTDNEDFDSGEGSGSDLEQTEENRDNIRLLAESIENVEEADKVQHNKAM